MKTSASRWSYHLIPYLERLIPDRKALFLRLLLIPQNAKTGRLHQPSCFFLCTGFGAGEAEQENSPPRRSSSRAGTAPGNAADFPERAEGIIAPAGITAGTVDPLLPQQFQNRLLIGTVPDAAGIGQEHPLSGAGFQLPEQFRESGGAVFRNRSPMPSRSGHSRTGRAMGHGAGHRALPLPPPPWPLPAGGYCRDGSMRTESGSVSWVRFPPMPWARTEQRLLSGGPCCSPAATDRSPPTSPGERQRLPAGLPAWAHCPTALHRPGG